MARTAKDLDIASIIYVELDRSVAYSSQSLRENRKKSWDYYLNRDRGDEIEGRSQVQDTSVRDTVHALLAQIMPAYATDSVVAFEPDGPDDVDQAEAESLAVNNLFTETNQGYLELNNAVSDALLFRNGVIKVWVEEREEVGTRSFMAPAADVLAQAPEGEDWEHIGTEDGLATFRVKAEAQKLNIEAIEQGYFFVNPNQQDQNLQETDFIAELTYFTRSELKAMGISDEMIRKLPPNTTEDPQSSIGWQGTDIAAKYIEGNVDVHRASTYDREIIECYWVHMTLDRDGDGIGEKYRFLVSNRHVLQDDPVEFYPYASGAGWIVPHRWSGLSVYDLLRITQDERTNARRQLNDNMNVANNQRPIYDPATTEQEDVNNGAPGRGIRSKRPETVGFVPVQDIISNSLGYLQYTDQVRSEQTGAALQMASAEGQLVREASGISVDMQLAPREQMAAMVSRNLAETLVRNTFLLIHSVLRLQWKSPIQFQKSGDWQMSNPAEWQRRERINVAVGLSPGERRRQSMALQYIHQLQLQLIQGGSANITTDWAGFHKSISDWMRAAELDTGNEYFLDPMGQKSLQGQQAAAEQQEQQAQAQQQQLEQQNAMTAMMMRLEQLDREIERWKHETDLRFNYWKEGTNAEIKLEELEANERNSEREGAGAGQAPN